MDKMDKIVNSIDGVCYLLIVLVIVQMRSCYWQGRIDDAIRATTQPVNP